VLTHIKRLKDPEEFLKRFLGTLEGLKRAGRLARFFSASAEFQADQVVLAEFLNVASPLRAGFEFRHDPVHDDWTRSASATCTLCRQTEERILLTW